MSKFKRKGDFLRTLDKEIVSEIINLYTIERVSQTEISKRLNIDVRRIKKTLQENNIELINQRKGKTFVAREIQDEVVNVYKSGVSRTEISIETGLDMRTINRILDNNNVYIRTQGEMAKKYEVDYTFFEKIDTEAKAYWLGFIYADGYISKKERDSDVLGIALSSKDRKHLELFKQNIRASNPILDYEGTTPQGNPSKYSRINIHNQKLVDDIFEKGVFYNKSLIIKFPTEKQVPDSLINHFLRGYFDGDGCITQTNNRYSFQMVGTKEFLSGVISVLGANVTIGKTGNIYAINIKGNLQVNKIMDYLYKDAIVFLRRKAEICLDLKLTNAYNHA